jgi:hypothetical protein
MPKEWSVKMNNLLPPNDPVEAMGEAYELLLESALQKTRQSGALVHQMIEECRGDIVALNKFGDHEIVMLEDYVRRDLMDAARYLDKTGNDLKFWLGFDVARVKREFWERFSEAADQAAIALHQFNEQAANAEYHSGELVGLGTLVCDQCGEKYHSHKPDRIPPCSKCNNTHFHRPNFE